MSPASNELPGFFICHTIYIFAEKDKANEVPPTSENEPEEKSEQD